MAETFISIQSLMDPDNRASKFNNILLLLLLYSDALAAITMGFGVHLC